MNLLVIITAIVAVASAYDYDEEEKKHHQKRAVEFEERLIPFSKRIALEANYYSRGQFIVSPHNIWYGIYYTDDQKELYSFLNLPDKDDERQKIYSQALMLNSGTYFAWRSQAIAVDETVNVKKEWNTLTPGGMPDYLDSLKYNKPFGRVQKFVDRFESNIPNSAHVVGLDHYMYDIQRSTAFPGSIVQKGPFYNEQGEPIATVEYLIMKDKFRVAYFPEYNIKVLEVPFGSGGDPFLLLAVGGNPEDMIETVLSRNIFSTLKLTEEPIDVAIPRLAMSSAIEMGPIFDDMRSSKVFSNPAYIRNKGNLPELPSGYYHMVTVNVSESLDRSSVAPTDLPVKKTNLAVLQEEGFVVNRPFLFALYFPLYLSDIRVPVFIGINSHPGKRGEQKIFEDIYNFE